MQFPFKDIFLPELFFRQDQWWWAPPTVPKPLQLLSQTTAHQDLQPSAIFSIKECLGVPHSQTSYHHTKVSWAISTVLPWLEVVTKPWCSRHCEKYLMRGLSYPMALTKQSEQRKRGSCYTRIWKLKAMLAGPFRWQRILVPWHSLRSRGALD